jgi:hypothetical protein
LDSFIYFLRWLLDRLFRYWVLNNGHFRLFLKFLFNYRLYYTLSLNNWFRLLNNNRLRLYNRFTFNYRLWYNDGLWLNNWFWFWWFYYFYRLWQFLYNWSRWSFICLN